MSLSGGGGEDRTLDIHSDSTIILQSAPSGSESFDTVCRTAHIPDAATFLQKQYEHSINTYIGYQNNRIKIPYLNLY